MRTVFSLLCFFCESLWKTHVRWWKNVKSVVSCFLSIFIHSKNASGEYHPRSNSAILSIKLRKIENTKIKNYGNYDFSTYDGDLSQKRVLFMLFLVFFSLSILYSFSRISILVRWPLLVSFHIEGSIWLASQKVVFNPPLFQVLAGQGGRGVKCFQSVLGYGVEDKGCPLTMFVCLFVCLFVVCGKSSIFLLSYLGTAAVEIAKNEAASWHRVVWDGKGVVMCGRDREIGCRGSSSSGQTAYLSPKYPL